MVSLALRSAAWFSVAAVTCAASLSITENITDSLPRGLYIRSFAPVERSPFLTFGLPDNMRAFFDARGDIGFFGHPRHGFLKRVAAVAGDEVCGDGRTISINGKVVGTIRTNIPHQELLPVWTECRRLLDGEVLPMADAPGSIDGRFYGPVSAARATGYRMLWQY